MKKFRNYIKTQLDILNLDIYAGDARETYLRNISKASTFICVAALAMSLLNFIQGSDKMTLSTLAISVVGGISYISTRYFKDVNVAKILYWILFASFMSVYTVQGSNEGFAILWSMMIPMGYMFFIDLALGVCLSAYLEILFCITFYSPIRDTVAHTYSEIFMDRFPLMYFFGIIFHTFIMITYHKSILKNYESEELLKENLEKMKIKYKDAEWKKIEAELENKTKTDFLEKVSHEIRTPITGIIGMNEMITKETTEPNINKYSKDITRSCNDLVKMIDRLFDMTPVMDNTTHSLAADDIEDNLNTDLTGLNILAVDDNSINRMVVNNYLKDTGCEISFANDGGEALEATMKEKYDIILMDHMMPYMDGMEAVRRIRKDKKNPNNETYIVALTANAVSGVKERYLKNGFNEYIAKPINYEPFIQFMYNFKCKNEDDDNNKNIIPDTLVIKDLGMENALGDEEFYKEVLTDFYEQGATNLEKLRVYYETEDYDNYRIIVHALKNNANIIGATHFAALSKKHEFAVKDNNIDIIKENLEFYMEYYKKLLDEVKGMI